MSDGQQQQPAPEFEGVMVVHFPPATRGQPSPAWRTSFSTQDGQIVNTVGRAVIHLEVTDLAWAELTMFADPAGRPVLNVGTDGRSLADVTETGPDGEDRIRERTFRYLIGFAPGQPAPAPAAAEMPA